jgi:hypothetical protein
LKNRKQQSFRPGCTQVLKSFSGICLFHCVLVSQSQAESGLTCSKVSTNPPTPQQLQQKSKCLHWFVLGHVSIHEPVTEARSMECYDWPGLGHGPSPEVEGSAHMDLGGCLPLRKIKMATQKVGKWMQCREERLSLT